MKLSVYSLKKVLFKGEAAQITCKTEVGEITILNNHQPIIGLLAKGTMRIIDGEAREHFLPVVSGFLEVKPSNETRLIIE